MLTLAGFRRPGSNSANKNLPRQKGLFATELPEIAGEVQSWHNGTLNVNLEKLLLVARPDYAALLNWAPQVAVHAKGEMFWLVRCRLEIVESRETVAAFLYVAHHSEWRKRPYVHEIVAPTVNVRMDGPIRLHIDRDFKTIAYPWCERGEAIILE